MTVGPNFSSALRTVLVEAATASWEFWFGLLEVFQKREGHCRVPVLHKEEGHKLGNWVHNQRQQKDRLSHDRIKRLDALGFVWDPLEEQWEEGFSNLQKFYNREGHCNIKRSHNEDGYKLGRWVGMQRLYRHSMVNDRKQKLENLGFIWNLPTHQWNIMFSKLNAYYEEYKTSLVPLRFDLGEPDRIGVWCNEQRANYKSGTISGSHIDQLEKFHDWRWNFDDWDKILNSVANFCFEKRCDVNGIPKNERLSSGQYLKNWMNSQRKKKKNGELEIDKIIKLERLPGWYWDEFDIWINNYECALNFAKINKHLRVPRGKLNTWIKGQRRRKEFLTEEQINLLEAIDCWSWDPIQDAWGKGISELRLYQKHKNHVYVPQRYTSKTGFKLGLWVHKCRQEYKSGKLKKTRIRDLETFPYWVWDPLTHLWEEAFIKLQQFHEKEGHCKVPARHMEDDHKLGQWVSSQRSKKDSLSPDRIKRLDDLGFIWDASKTKSASKND
jgi:hypothetical protein